MDTPTLKLFLAAVETGSFSRAGERHYLSQPAVSKRIANLEQELGLRLFDRIGRQLQLTEAGHTLLPRARTILGEINDAKRALGNLAGTLGAALSMATSHHIGLHRLPPALEAFHRQHPEVQLDLHFMDSEAACLAVAQGRLEIAVVTLPAGKHDELVLQKVWNDPLEIVVARNHPLGRKKTADIDTLLALPAILPGPGTVTRELILSAFGRRQPDINIVMSTNYLEVLKMLATIGLGWSALPHTMIDAGLKVVQIDKIRLGRELGIVTHGARTLSNAARIMMDLIRNR